MKERISQLKEYIFLPLVHFKLNLQDKKNHIITNVQNIFIAEIILLHNYANDNKN